MKKMYLMVLALGGASCIGPTAHAQLSLTGQLRTRTELRDGYGNLAPRGSQAAVFTSQRTRLSFGYQASRLRMNVTLQDVRVWGQDASSISVADGNRLSVHEAWGEIQLINRADTTLKFRPIDELSLKVGRQELVYDDVRLLGNLDWLQQGRRFDAALLKFRHQGWKLDLGGGFNQNSDAFDLTGTSYIPGNVPTTALSTKNTLLPLPSGFIPISGKNGAPILTNAVSTNGQTQQFKAFQMAYLQRSIRQQTFSALFFKDDFSKYRIDSIGSESSGYVYGRKYDVPGVHSRLTYGAMLLGKLSKRVNYQAFGYLQSGRDRDGLRIRQAYHYGGNAFVQQGHFSFGLGYEVLSGNKSGLKTGETSRFDPLYGTPHRHWGYMDYFYVGTGSPSGGLQDSFFKSKYAHKRLTASFDVHYFALASPVLNRSIDGTLPSSIQGSLGWEYDFVATYLLNSFTSLELGYSFMQGNNRLEYVKQNTVNQKDKQGQWAYLMLNIRPDFLAKNQSSR
ncbi:hypothetical protein BWI93_27090 [Siphonobacter sp. BAB-5385]|uniref:alginate export family protein n=1 Tax=Siphonobacter sp. BAB-5385 TaxID=1864822 RepID=UPI000B9DD9F6|nr:hypothetical protein BWI93_27090 [Siphonobacter sp. BAB-5385]